MTSPKQPKKGKTIKKGSLVINGRNVQYISVDTIRYIRDAANEAWTTSNGLDVRIFLDELSRILEEGKK